MQGEEGGRRIVVVSGVKEGVEGVKVGDRVVAGEF